MIAKITSELSSSRRTLRASYEMNFVLVPDNQPLVPIDFFNYEDEPILHPIRSRQTSQSMRTRHAVIRAATC
jgi:hypothetical protein